MRFYITLVLLYVNPLNNIFKHFKLHQNHLEPAYSICIIQEILHSFDWKQVLHKKIHFPVSFQARLHNYYRSTPIRITNKHDLILSFSKLKR
jgi:hypothetical protein